MDSKERFSSRVESYVAARPRYPREVIAHLQRDIGLTPAWTIADIGSGTGISAELFLANGNRVIGVEPNTPMRQAAEKSLFGFANFQSVNATAEATTLPDASVDLVIAAQAFHWFDIDAARREFTRILRPGGWTLLMWNNRKLTGTAFLEAYEKLLIDFGSDYLKIRHNNIDAGALARFFGTSSYRTATFPNNQILDFEGLRARVLSSSYMPADNPRMLRRLREMFDRFNENGKVTIEYRTELFYGRLSAQSSAK